MLSEIAPDREELLMDPSKSIEDIRNTLKIRVSDSLWLHCVEQTSTKIRPSLVARTSKFIEVYSASNENADIPYGPRRVLSASSMSPITPSNTENQDLPLRLSTPTKLTSPRPLGPTHILMISSVQSLLPCVQIPINDLLFVLHIPHLANANTLPHRLPGVLPRVRIRVQDMATFPPLVIYFHTSNQAALFRAILPEWIRDVLHPLPARSHTPQKGKGHVSARRRSGNTLGTSSSSVTSSMESFVPLVAERTIESVARELAGLNTALGGEVLVSAAATLNGLRDNMEYIGFFGHAVWTELETSLEVLVKAINKCAQIEVL